MRATFILAGITSLLAMSPFAQAEEARPSFSGAYIGMHAGEAWGSSKYQTNPGCPPGSNAVFCNDVPDASSINGDAIADTGRGRLSSNGLTGGMQAGYSWQKNSLVFGGEANVSALDVNESTTASGTFPLAFLGTSYTLTEKMSANWQASLRGRVGAIVTPNLMLYTTGGVAFTDLKVTSTYADNAIDMTFPGGTGSRSISSIRTGWTLGAGGEWLLGGPWSVAAEYAYTNFGSMNFAVPTTNTAAYTQTMRVKAHLETHILRAGVNYRF